MTTSEFLSLSHLKTVFPSVHHHDVQPWNAVNLGQLFLSRNEAQLTFTEGKVSLRIGGGEVYLEAKVYSGIDVQANKTPAAA